MGAVMEPKQPPSEDKQLWALILEVAGASRFTPECEAELKEIVQKSVRRLKFETGTRDSAKALEVKDNFRLLIETMKEKATDRSELNKSDLNETLLKLCPLFPIC